MEMNRSRNNSGLFGGIGVGIGILLFFILGIAIFSRPSNTTNASKGKLLATKEIHVIEKTKYYERGIEQEYKESLKAEIYEPKKFVDIYGRKKAVVLSQR
jgi:D-serine dehydratase